MERLIKSLIANCITWAPVGVCIGITANAILNQEWSEAILLSFVTAFLSIWTKFSSKFLQEVEKEAEARGGSLARWTFVLLDRATYVLQERAENIWRQVTATFESEYFQRLIYICRNYETQGLDKDYVLKLSNVFIPLKVSQKSVATISPDIIQQPENNISGQQDISNFLMLMRKDPSLKRLVILGAPGTGKTTLLRYLTLIYASRQHHKLLPRKAPRFVPVLIYLRDVYTDICKNPKLTLGELINIWIHHLQQIDPLKPPRGWFDNRLKQGECLILLDGLDEIDNENEKKKVSNWIDFQMCEYPDTPFIITSRPLGYMPAPLQQDVTILELQPLSSQQIEQFVHKWYSETELTSSGVDDLGIRDMASRQAHDLVKRIHTSPPLAAMSVNPLLLTMIATVHRRGNALPGRRIELYREICNILLEKRQRAKGLPSSFTALQKQSILQGIALNLMKRESRSFTSPVVKGTIEDRLKAISVSAHEAKPHDFLEQVRHISGLLIERENNVYEFAHRSLQEYLAAVEIRKSGQVEILIDTLSDSRKLSWWAETIRLYAAQGDASDIINAAVQASTVDSRALAFDCLQEAQSVLPSLRNKLENIFAEGLEEKSNKHRVSILEEKIKIELEGTRGFFKGVEGILSLKIVNSGESSVQFMIRLENTANYEVTNQPEEKKINFPPNKPTVIQYKIITRNLSEILLQIKLDNTVYKKPLKIVSVHNNPYLYGPPIQQSFNFFGRDKEVQILQSNVLGDIGAHTMLIGEQRSGKTSLLFQIKNCIKLPCIPIYIPLIALDKDFKVSLEILLHQISSKLDSLGISELANSKKPLKYGIDFIEEFGILLQKTKSQVQGARIILLLDEAHSISKVEPSFQEILREVFSQFSQDVRVIMACYYNFFEELEYSGSPLHNIFEYLFLNPFEEKDLVNLINQPAEKFGYRFESSAQEEILNIAGGHPYYTQIICAKSFSQAQKEEKKVITFSHINIAYREVLKSDKKRFEAGYWVSFSEKERNFLKSILERETNTDISYSETTINKLMAKSVIKPNSNSIEFTSRFFRDWTTQLINELNSK